MFESVDLADEGPDEDANEILASIKEESKATEPSMPHYLPEPPLGDNT